MAKTIREPMTGNVCAIDADQSVAHAAKMLKDEDVGKFSLVRFEATIGFLPAHNCRRDAITGIPVKADHLVESLATADIERVEQIIEQLDSRRSGGWIDPKLKALVAALALAACSPQAPSEPTPPAAPAAPSPEAESQELLDALTPVVAADIGQPVSFTIDTVRVQNEWAWLVVQPQAPGGGAIDWARTKYGEQSAEGVLDGGGTTYALLKRENGQWRVLEFVIGPTDVAYADWPERHDAPAGLMGLAAE